MYPIIGFLAVAALCTVTIGVIETILFFDRRNTRKKAAAKK